MKAGIEHPVAVIGQPGLDQSLSKRLKSGVRNAVGCTSMRGIVSIREHQLQHCVVRLRALSGILYKHICDYAGMHCSLYPDHCDVAGQGSPWRLRYENVGWWTQEPFSCFHGANEVAISTAPASPTSIAAHHKSSFSTIDAVLIHSHSRKPGMVLHSRVVRGL